MTASDMPAMSRRWFLKASAAGFGAASLTAVAPQAVPRAVAASVPSAAVDVIDAVLDAFQTHRLVGLGESHGLQNHHDVLDLLLNDPRVPAVIDDVVIEFANALYQPTIDQFIAGQPVDNVDLRPVWRNTTQSPEETWDEPVYEQFFRTVRAVNWTLAPDQQIRVLAGDPPIDWSKITKASQAQPFENDRYSHPASVVEQQVLATAGRRALLCYGQEHLLHLAPTEPFPNNLANLIEHRTGERVYTIIDLVPFAGDPGGLAKSLTPYARNTVIPTAGTWLGAFDMGYIPPAFIPPRSGAKHGEPINPWCGVALGSLADAGLYMGPPELLTASWWNPAIFLDPTYWKELQRRNAIAGNQADLAQYRSTDLPARFARTAIRHSVRCAKT